ncbi:MAG TPA: SDR family oxidoreductase [Bryobacteraceae bacterium]|nr:SDR family oxidoreductase [Bryobacteraceae bacterium]
MADQDLTGKVIVITGASSGFGKGASREFAQRGASLVLAARRDSLLDELARECGELGGAAISVPTDVSNSEEMEQLAHAAASKFGHIDVWVNNAGAGVLGRFEEVPLEEHRQVIETDLMGTLYGSYFAMRIFREQRFGILINIASLLGKVPTPYYASYTAAKHGVVGLSGSIRLELKENSNDAIRVCTVMPTSMDTPFFEHAANYTGHEAVPIPPVYDAREVIDAIVRLATDPEDEVIVGTAAKIATVAHNLAPGLTENMMGRQTHKAIMEDAPPAEDTSGSLVEPSMSGTEVSGGWIKK